MKRLLLLRQLPYFFSSANGPAQILAWQIA